jgi:valyl-tRNA synthetase
MGRATEIRALDGAPPAGVVQAVVGEATIMLPLAEVIDLSAERARLAKERARIANEADKTTAKLGSDVFVSRAPAEIVQEMRNRLDAQRTEMARLDAAIARISA